MREQAESIFNDGNPVNDAEFILGFCFGSVVSNILCVPGFLTIKSVAMKSKVLSILGLNLVPPLILYMILIFENKLRSGREKLIQVMINFLIWLLISSVILTPQVRVLG